VIGGKNKYLINGHNAQKGRVENFFHSVQLNVNNPHFLIMQGRITKVLNMKPQEILSMLEEASGTRMYETKKASSQQVMEKKELKMIEIDRMLREEIQPTIEKLRKERDLFFKWQTNDRTISYLNRLVLAYVFYQAEQNLTNAKQELEDLKTEEGEITHAMKDAAGEQANCEQNITIHQKKKEAEQSGGLKELEEQSNELSKAVVKATEKFKGKRADRELEERNKQAAIGAVADGKASIKAKGRDIEKARAAHAAAAESDAAHDSELEALERKQNAVAMGMSEADDGDDKTFADQLKEAKGGIVECATELKQAEMRVKHLTPTLKEKKAAAKGAEKELATMSAALVKDEANMEKIQAAMDKLDFSEAKEHELEKVQTATEREAATVRDRVEALDAKLSGRLNFDYTDPEPGFDRSKVHGPVAKLITVKRPDAAMALEVTAGSKLYNVVVADVETGKKLLKKGRLKRRVTIIPLNKVQPREIKPEVVKRAEAAVGKTNVDVALSLVGYGHEVEAAMKYVFGSNFICPNMDVAKEITFNDKIRTKSVTLDGDVMDPSGTLTGGAQKSSAPVLSMLHELNEARARLDELEATLAQVTAELTAIRQSKAKYAALKEQWDLKEHECKLNRARVEQSTSSQVVGEVASLEASLEASKLALTEVKQRKKDLEKKVGAIEKDMAQAQAERDSNLKKVEKAIAAAKKEAGKAKSATAKAKQAVDEAILELEALEAELEVLQGQVGAFDEVIAKLQGDEETLAEAVSAVKEQLGVANDELHERRSKVAACDAHIQELSQKVAAFVKVQSKGEIDLKKLKNKIAGFDKKKAEAGATVAALVQEHTWIPEEKSQFGQPGTEYDFKSGDPERDPAKCKMRLDQLNAEQAKLEKSVNMKVLRMFENTEKSAADLQKKKRIVEADRAKIGQAIRELDQKKNEALEKAFRKVNKDFGSIFSALLPGTSAELAPPEGKTVLDGLQVRVAFGSIWKESLTELSGGQRSLVALSLILSLLLFKPAPLYILDEIDAALDLSHTQNIGQMLKSHFKQSQFIVVSLKEGMFNNANVLFKTAFVDGVSTVRRFAQSKSARAAVDDGDGSTAKENVRPSKGKGRAAAGGGAAARRPVGSRN
jgi:structural maintenance of chromosome 2